MQNRVNAPRRANEKLKTDEEKQNKRRNKIIYTKSVYNRTVEFRASSVHCSKAEWQCAKECAARFGGFDVRREVSKQAADER